MRRLTWNGSHAAMNEHIKAAHALKPKKKRKKRKKDRRKGPKSTKTQRQLQYRGYLKTKWWRARRASAIELAGGKCEQCGTREKLQVHHLTYVRRGRELDTDLQVLCNSCHGKKHQK